MQPSLRTTVLTSALLLLHTHNPTAHPRSRVETRAHMQDTHRHSDWNAHEHTKSDTHENGTHTHTHALLGCMPSTHFTDAHMGGVAHTFVCTAASQLRDASSLRRACASVPPPLAPNRHPTHITQTLLARSTACPSSTLGLVQARNHPPGQPTTAPPLSCSILC